MITTNAGRKQGALMSGVRKGILTAAAIAALAQTTGAAFAAGPERSLAGISIFSPGSEVTKKFGNPSRILVGGTAPVPGSAVTPSGSAAAGGGPGGALAPPSAPGGNAGAGLLPGFGGIPTGGAGGPGAPGAGGPGAPGVPTDPNAAQAPPPKPAVTLIYDRANGGTLEFTISPDKRVIQIRETGYTGAYGTTRGIKLGTSYAAVVAKYGYPEDTYIEGPIIDTDYKDTLHCGFQFLDQKLVGIIVVSPD